MQWLRTAETGDTLIINGKSYDVLVTAEDGNITAVQARAGNHDDITGIGTELQTCESEARFIDFIMANC